MSKIQSRMFIAVLLQDLHTLEKLCQKFWKTKFNITSMAKQFSIFKFFHAYRWNEKATVMGTWQKYEHTKKLLFFIYLCLLVTE